MTERCQHLARVFLGLVMLACLGCGSEPPFAEKPAAPSAAPASPAAAPATTESASAEPAVAEPAFEPPTLEELDKTAKWQDQTPRDPFKELNDYLAAHPAPITAEAALALENSDQANNLKIREALGRQPESAQQVDWNARATRHLLGDVNTTNGVMYNTIHEFDLMPMIHIDLISFDWRLEPYAWAAVVEKWQTSEDRLADKMVLRRDVTWSDGRPFTAHDVEFTYHAVMNEKIPVPAVRTHAKELRGVKAYDDHTVVFFHKEPLATNTWNMSFYLLPKHVYEPLYRKLDTLSWLELQQTPEFQQLENNPVTGGAYQLVSRTRNQEIVCKRREAWYMHQGKEVREKPYFEEVRFRIIEDPNTALLALMSGRLDDLELNQQQWMTQAAAADFYERNTKARAVEWTYFYFGWNNKSPLFSDRRVREALSYAFDYREMFERLLYGLCEPCAGIWEASHWCAPNPPLEPYQQNLDKAEQLLDEAGWTDSDGDGIRDKEINGRRMPFEFNMLVRQDPERVRICELMKFNLEQIGVRCNVQPLEATVLVERMNSRSFEAYYAGWGAGADPDTSKNVWNTEAITDGRNYLQYSNPEIDRLFVEGQRELDRQKRAEIYAETDRIIYRDQPCTFLFWRNAFYGYNKQLRGYFFSPRGPYHYAPGFHAIWRVE